MKQKRISDYGYRIGHHESGPRNKITDVPGVRVGHTTVEDGNQHTGVTVIVPGEGNPFLKKYLASAYVLTVSEKHAVLYRYRNSELSKRPLP